MSKTVRALTRHRRFRILLVLLVVFGMFLGFLIVPVEQTSPKANIRSLGDGAWWAVTTITSVGYGDYYPVTPLGKLMGATLQLAGVLAFGLLIGIVTVTLAEPKERFYWSRVFSRLDNLEKRLERTEKLEDYVVKQAADKKREDAGIMNRE